VALKPAIDYTNKDFSSLRQAMLDLARFRLPEWVDRSPADLGVLLVDLFAYMGDVILYYQDRIANESFLPTATERRSVLNLLRLIGYELAPPVAASADLTLIFKVPAVGESTQVTIPLGAQFATKPSDSSAVQVFEYLGPDLQIDLQNFGLGQLARPVYAGLPIRNCHSVPTEVLGSSTGEPNQQFRLAQTPLILESLLVEVNEGAGFVAWDRRDNLVYHTDDQGRVLLSGPDSHDYYIQYDENDIGWVIFGDGVYGRSPMVGTNNIRATYRVGGGAAGNVATGAIVDPRTQIRLLDSVTNPRAAAGGADRESIDHAVRFGPQAFRSASRAVTLNDFVALTHQAGGIAKVRARSHSWNQVDLFIAPEGDTCRVAPDDLKQRLIAYFEDKRMVGTFVHIQDPTCSPIEVQVRVVAEHHFNAESVRQGVEAAIRKYLSFTNVDFAQTIYLSGIYQVVESVPGVFAATVTRFRRQGLEILQGVLDMRLRKLGVRTLDELPEELIRALRSEVVPEGRIEMGDFEIPSLGTLVVTAEEKLV
jgi:hypothetical protein